MKDKTMTKEQMIKTLIAHGQSAMDFFEFYDTYGVKHSYKVADVRAFLGY